MALIERRYSTTTKKKDTPCDAPLRDFLRLKRSGDGELAGWQHRSGGLLRQLVEEAIPAFAGRLDVLGAQGTADALLGERSRIDGIVQKPRSVVVPEMVVLIRFADAQRGEGDEVVGGHDA